MNSASYSYLANAPLVSQIAFTNNGAWRMTTSKQFDQLNRLQSMASVAPTFTAASFEYTYNNANQRTERREADGVYWRYEYDPLGQVTSGKKYWADGIPVAGQQFEYAFDDIGNRKQTKVGGDQSGANFRTNAYTANLLNQYSSRTVPGAVDVIGVALATNTVAVDGQAPYRKGEYFRKELTVVNTSVPVWKSLTVSAPGETPVTRSEFVPKTPELFTHDLDGNLVADGRWNYTWDGENRLVAMAARTGVGPQISLKFEYDAQGRRIRKQVWGNAAWSGSATNDLRFVYDGWNLIAVLSPQSTVLRSFTWGLDLSGSLQGAGGVGGLLSMTAHAGANAGTYFYCFDGNGNVVGLVSAASGEIAAQYEYGPFAEVLRASGPMAEANRFRFSTKYQDQESGLLYFGYRYYDPSTGRWKTRDPIGEDGGPNLYGFNENNPVDHFDMLGMWHATVHNGLTWGYAHETHGFGWKYSDVIAEADQGVDNFPPFGWESSLPLVGQQDRHMYYLKNGEDSRVWWYKYEFAEAVKELQKGDRAQKERHCTKAAKHFGKGLHSIQDKSAHRPWPGGRNWDPLKMHPAWWDAFTDDELGAWGLSEKFWNEEGNRNLQTPGWGVDYIPWYGTDPLTGSGDQRRSQEKAREEVKHDTDEAVGAFKDEIRKTCFCRQKMLKVP